MKIEETIDTSEVLELLVNKGLRGLSDNVRYDIHPNQSIETFGSPYYDSVTFDIIFCGFRTKLFFVDNSGVLDIFFIVNDAIHMSFKGLTFTSITQFINVLDGHLVSYGNYAHKKGLTTYFI